ncbi:MAG: riboflavin synthase [Peptoniphilus sp.]|nr:riboflavin synthase [Peptoniphilus sp.]MDD7362832.1 riboflavin synthase [Bacillota bacterium]MDY6043976.1 riboflavin synthase [Peptoniphilus sp.]
MFTGIVEEVGRIARIDRRGQKIEVEVAAEKVMEGTQIGDSISTNGVCLTVTRITESGFCADMMTVTAKKSGLDRLASGSRVNLERALLPTTRMGGHILQGHVDTRGKLAGIEPDEGGYIMSIEVEERYFPYYVPQGSVGLNGVSLTVARAGRAGFSVSLIPETLRSTNLGDLKAGDALTVEFDIVGKYILRQQEWEEESKGIDLDFLRKNGF